MSEQITYFVTGIDTDCGKTLATGFLAKEYKEQGKTVMTQKIIQTGCEGIAEDIKVHREIMGMIPQPVDMDQTTCPYVFKHPCSPHLAAKLEGVSINPAIIQEATEKLQNRFEVVLIEGVGGLYVPINEHIKVIDYVVANKYPVILVSTSKLGSINHTLMTLEACKKRGIDVSIFIYNIFADSDKHILEDSQELFCAAYKEAYPNGRFVVMGESGFLSS